MNSRGEIFPLVIIATAVVLISTIVTISGSQLYFNNTTHAADSEKAANLAEAGIDKSLASLNKTGGNFNPNPDTETTLGAPGEGSFTIKITTKDTATKIIEATGYIPNKTKPKVKRTLKIEASRGVGAAFVYGIQVGEGGLALGKHNIVTGTVYSNGNITSDDDNTIKGDAWVAGGPQPTADQSTDCSGLNCDPNGFIFGKSVSGNAQLDVGMSFKPSSSGVLNKVSIKVKKFGNPPDVIFRLLQDSAGKPDKNAVLATGTLYANLVTGSYGWIDVTFSSSPALIVDTPYWLMIDTSSDANNYWFWQNDLAQSYNRGSPKWSDDWQAKTPIWHSFSGDLSFKTFMGGAPTSIRAAKSLNVNGDVHANTIEKLTIGKDAYFQTIISSTVAGAQHSGSADPPPKVFPISDANVLDWKSQVDKPETTINNDIINCVSTLGPVKIAGNLTLDPAKNCTTTVKSPIWITGNLTANNKNTFKLDSSYGATSGIIIVDGKVDMDNNNHFDGTGTGSSLLMVLSNYDSRSDGISAIHIKNNGNTGVFYAGTGIIEPGNNNTFKELTAWRIKLVENSTIDYETGLSSTLFTSGPSGSYSLVKGTYQVK